MDGIVRITSAPFQLYGIWTEDDFLAMVPEYLPGIIGSHIDSEINKEWTTRGNAQLLMEIGGDLGINKSIIN